jgi:hypothetical protein
MAAHAHRRRRWQNSPSRSPARSGPALAFPERGVGGEDGRGAGEICRDQWTECVSLGPDGAAAHAATPGRPRRAECSPARTRPPVHPSRCGPPRQRQKGRPLRVGRLNGYAGQACARGCRVPPPPPRVLRRQRTGQVRIPTWRGPSPPPKHTTTTATTMASTMARTSLCRRPLSARPRRHGGRAPRSHFGRRRPNKSRCCTIPNTHKHEVRGVVVVGLEAPQREHCATGPAAKDGGRGYTSLTPLSRHRGHIHVVPCSCFSLTLTQVAGPVHAAPRLRVSPTVCVCPPPTCPSLLITYCGTSLRTRRTGSSCGPGSAAACTHKRRAAWSVLPPFPSAMAWRVARGAVFFPP